MIDLKPIVIEDEDHMSGFLTPDGKFYFAEYGCHSFLLDSILKVDRYREMFEADLCFCYLSVYDYVVDFEIGEMTEEFKAELKRIYHLMSTDQFRQDFIAKLDYVMMVDVDDL